MKRFLFVLALLALMVGIATPVLAQECDDALGCVEIGEDDPIVIASMLTTSGATSFLGADSEGGIELAIAGWDGELLGHEIEWVKEDSLCSAEGGQTAAQRVAADESVLGVVGTNCSSAAAAALPIISEAGLVLISPSNTAPTLTNDDTEAGGVYQPGYFRTAHNDLFQGAIAAQFAYDVLGARSLATIHDGSPYADGLQDVMATTFAELGGEVVFQGAVNVGDTEMGAILTQIASDSPDVIYFPIFEPESNFIAAQSLDIDGLENTILMGADGSFVDSFPENTGDAAVGMYLSGPLVAGEAYDAFLELWDEEIGGVPPSGFHAHAFDATNILLDAIEAVAVETDDGGLSIGRQALRDAIAATTDFEGLTGTLTCQTEAPFIGDCATGEALAVFEITQAELDGNWPPPVAWQPGMDMDE
ncbi:MAG: branched-chain amino acid ABC transporter substrate-binding protein [Anaerolineae bacterium]|nr:branched-chain amino acid ABC transporter substrate-binding protein [Anaerolineae bacterium]